VAHISVLLHEAIESLKLRNGGTFVDGTFGAGGHSRAIAESIGKSGHLISFDQDKSVFTEEVVGELNALAQFTPVVNNFRHIESELDRLGVHAIDGALFDLGLSSTQLDESGRGFSFQRDEPLWMTFLHEPKEDDVTAMTVVNHWSQETLATILKGFGEEKFAWRVAQGIVEARKLAPFSRTSELVEVIRQSTPAWYHHGRTHFATRTFQALRMAVNDELGAIESGIMGAFTHMKKEGHIAVISFHSIEDRLVKQLFKKMSDAGQIKLITKKPIISGEEELTANPRARSAKLRVVEKI